MTGSTRTDFWLRSSRPLSLAAAALQLAGALGGVRLKWVERPQANQSHDFFYRLLGAGVEVELGCTGWQPEVPQQEFWVSGRSAEEVMRRALAGTCEWTIGCGAGVRDARCARNA